MRLHTLDGDHDKRDYYSNLRAKAEGINKQLLGKDVPHLEDNPAHAERNAMFHGAAGVKTEGQVFAPAARRKEWAHLAMQSDLDTVIFSREHEERKAELQPVVKMYEGAAGKRTEVLVKPARSTPTHSSAFDRVVRGQDDSLGAMDDITLRDDALVASLGVESCSKRGKAAGARSYGGERRWRY